LTSASNHLFWIISRGAGTTALILSSLAVCVGLTMGGKLLPGNAADRRSYHEVISLSVMVAIAVHGLTLVGDSFVHPSLIDVTVPFALGYQRLATTLGIIAGWSFIALGLSFYARDRIGRARWRVIHRFTLLAWVGGLVHTLVEGTDAGQLWFLALVTITSAPVLVLLAMRVASVRARPRLDAGLPGSRSAASTRTARPTIHPGRAQ
jgi:sulfoxide reductase heme-binding subunit YedZ